MRRIDSRMLETGLEALLGEYTPEMQDYLHGDGIATAPYVEAWTTPIVVTAGAVPGDASGVAVIQDDQNWAVLTTGGHMQVCWDGILYVPRKDIEGSQVQWAGLDAHRDGVPFREFLEAAERALSAIGMSRFLWSLASRGGR